MQRKEMGIDGDAANDFERHARISKRIHDPFQVVYQHMHTRFKDQVYAAVSADAATNCSNVFMRVLIVTPRSRRFPPSEHP